MNGKTVKKVFFKNCLHHLGSQMPLTPRIINLEEKENASVLALPVIIMLIAYV